MLKIEREMIINFNEQETEASVYTYSTRLLNRLQKISETHPDAVRKLSDNEYLVPKSYIKINPPRKLSDKTIERLKNLSLHR